MNTAAIPYLFQEDLYAVPSPGVVIILARPWENYTAEEKALLAKILGSVKRDLASVQITTADALSMPALASYQVPKILVFGSPVDNVRPYENVQAQGFSVIRADDLPALDDAKKKSLWLALRAMFGI